MGAKEGKAVSNVFLVCGNAKGGIAEETCTQNPNQSKCCTGCQSWNGSSCVLPTCPSNQTLDPNTCKCKNKSQRCLSRGSTVTYWVNASSGQCSPYTSSAVESHLQTCSAKFDSELNTCHQTYKHQRGRPSGCSPGGVCSSCDTRTVYIENLTCTNNLWGGSDPKGGTFLRYTVYSCVDSTGGC